MGTPYVDLEFNFFQMLVLRYLCFFSISSRLPRKNKSFKFLLKFSLVEYSSHSHLRYCINEKGRMYLRRKRRDRFRFWFPTTLSIIALFAGYDVLRFPLVVSVLQAIKQLVKTILENLDVFLGMVF